MGCLDENALLDYAGGHLSEATRAEIDAHVASCASCRELLAQWLNAGAADVDDTGDPERTVPLSPGRARRARPAAIPDSAREPSQAPRGGLAQGTRIGRYVVLRPLGEGGMGVVYTAWDPELDRTVCVKLLRSELVALLGDEAQPRLQREAQAMARVAHPNVVGIHDVGTWDGGLFIAMEYVRGGNLREWLLQAPRGWREVVDVFVQVGRGLEAAHAHGLIHRDIKPDNLLVGEDGRARLTDFGLVLQASGAHAARPEPAVAGASSGALDLKLTRPGRIMGTPAYMPPEQLAGRTVDALSDQFSFCASLFEALFDARPFSGDSVDEVCQNITLGRVSAVPAGKGARVPGWLKAVVLRGLVPDPSRRHPSMHELLRQLSRDAGRRRARLAVAGVVVLGAATAFAAPEYSRHSRLAACDSQQQALGGIWDSAAVGAITQAFSGTRLPHADAAWGAARDVVGGYADRWLGLRRDVCRAAVEDRLPEETLWQQDRCLARSLQALKSLSSLYRAADREVVSRSLSMAHALPDLDACGEVAVLTASPTPPPSDAALRTKVEEARLALVELRAQREAGRFRQVMEPVQALRKDVEALGYRPVEAEVLHLHALAQHDAGLVRDAVETLRRAAVAAEAGRHELLAARAWTDYVFTTGRRLKRFDEARLAVELAAAALERVGGEPVLAARLLTNRAGLESAQGNAEEAVKLNAEAVAAYRRLLGDEHPDTARALLQWGTLLYAANRDAEAKEVFQQALSALERSVGPSHPAVGSLLSSLGRVARRQGDASAGRAYYDRSIRLLEALDGPDHPDLAIPLTNRSILLQDMGLFDEARVDLRRVLELARRGSGDDSLEVAEAYAELSLVELRGREFAQALEYAERALRMARAKLPEGHVDFTYYESVLAHALSARGRWAEAQRLFESAARMKQAAAASGGGSLPDILTGLARTQVEQGQGAAAEQSARRALGLWGTQGADPADVAETRFVLARALWLNGQRSAALDEARGAVTDYGRSRQRHDLAAADVAKWLSARVPPR
ncbi:serine/threonine-protein kinase [Pyxidicoccus xibeiensis]|uniref:serine/threonine-protein kinase n=1 Tax=Pyxidicoccus xibeiensis TaxID=2906759 RepID=UPI0020A7DAD3|nr:serine/threonine-protein kinase [Pyxidicoccus xibeiensis]MCP3137759.1 tetratricopeptide repeat protein [Pyxidicoccus xibeiensis]